ncbi:glycosyltransferase family 39 protein [Candidatus Pacearchaeota archaeon]|nr:hypothetical protein [uncultured archaeon]MBS3076673.1 glycosyltransferase family 39 protein [Candidatus Pacearchaeota archaeon]
MENKRDGLSKRKKNLVNWFKSPTNLLFLAILILAFGIRLYYFSLTMNQPLWWDEAEYMSTAKGFAGITENTYSVSLNRLPGFPFLVSLFYTVGIGDEAVLRFFLSLIPSLIVIILMYFVLISLYSDKKIALISTAIFTVLWEHVFYSNRFHTENLSLIFELLAIFVLFRVYLKNQDFYFIKSRHAFLWIALFSVICILFRSANMVFIPVMIFFLIAVNFYRIPKKFKALSAISLAIVIIIGFSMMVFLSHKFEFVHQFYRYDFSLPWSTLSVFYGFYQSLVPFIPSILFYVFILGVATVLGGIIIFPEGLRRLNKNVDDNSYKADVFNLILIAGFLFFFLFMLRPSAFEYRWFFAFLPGMLAFTARGLTRIGDFLKTLLNSRQLAYIVIIILLVFGLYTQLQHSDMIVKDKLKSYQEVKDSGLWIKERTSPNDIVISSSQTQLAYYSERKIYNLNNFDSEENFTKFVMDNKPKYLVLSVFEPHPSWSYDWPQKNNESATPVQAYFADEARTKPVLVIYQINSA